MDPRRSRGRDDRSPSQASALRRRRQRLRIEQAVSSGKPLRDADEAALAVELAMDWQERPLRHAWPMIVALVVVLVAAGLMAAGGANIPWWAFVLAVPVMVVGCAGFIGLQRERAATAEQRNREVCEQAGHPVPEPTEDT